MKPKWSKPRAKPVTEEALAAVMAAVTVTLERKIEAMFDAQSNRIDANNAEFQRLADWARQNFDRIDRCATMLEKSRSLGNTSAAFDAMLTRLGNIEQTLTGWRRGVGYEPVRESLWRRLFKRREDES